jgi:hypothetical protein
MHADPARRSTRFGRWLDGYGVDALRRDLHAHGLPLLTQNAVYNWLGGVSVPNVATACAIAKLSCGRVQPADLLAHRDAMRATRHVERSDAGR